MAVRNFLVEADIDGRQTMLGGGPRNKDGGMNVTIYQRDEGRISRVVSVYCRRLGDKLETVVDVRGRERHTAVIVTDRD